MGLETVSTIGGGINTLKNIYNAIVPSSTGSTLSYSEAQKQAGSQLNNLYNSRLKSSLSSVNKDLVNRGFNGQQAGTDLATSTAAEIEENRVAAINSLASSLQQQSFNNSLQQSALNTQNQNAAQSALSSSLDWVKGLYTQPNLGNVFGSSSNNGKTSSGATDWISYFQNKG